AVKADPHPFPLQPLFDRLAQVFAPVARDKGLRLRFRPTSAWVMGDEVLTEQIVMNLVANALRYTQSGGVLVASRRRAGKVRIEVRDTGEGIAEADRQRIFDEFVQIGNTERDRRKGLGLGLAICARTATLLGTSVDLKATPGKGSAFAFELQATEPVAAAPTVAPFAERPLAGRLRLLIVDDDLAVREALGVLLKGWGVEFTLADGLDAARHALDTEAPFRLVLSDYRLREGHVGLDFLTGLKSLPDAPNLALITGDVDPGLMRRADEAGILLIHKPVDPARLRALINHLARQG
ncbi:MAG: response regulator, partial [Asticcacaulis sp.]|nr:response regulator [Asticcacaulis sp.]